MNRCLRFFALLVVFSSACASPARRDEDQSAKEARRGKRLVKIALELLDPASPTYNPEKGRSYLEYSIKHGQIKQVELSAPVVLELLKSERVATQKTHTLEQQLEIMKEIDLNREEDL